MEIPPYAGIGTCPEFTWSTFWGPNFESSVNFGVLCVFAAKANNLLQSPGGVNGSATPKGHLNWTGTSAKSSKPKPCPQRECTFVGASGMLRTIQQVVASPCPTTTGLFMKHPENNLNGSQDGNSLKIKLLGSTFLGYQWPRRRDTLTQALGRSGQKLCAGCLFLFV